MTTTSWLAGTGRQPLSPPPLGGSQGSAQGLPALCQWRIFDHHSWRPSDRGRGVCVMASVTLAPPLAYKACPAADSPSSAHTSPPFITTHALRSRISHDPGSRTARNFATFLFRLLPFTTPIRMRQTSIAILLALLAGEQRGGPASVGTADQLPPALRRPFHPAPQLTRPARASLPPAVSAHARSTPGRTLSQASNLPCPVLQRQGLPCPGAGGPPAPPPPPPAGDCPAGVMTLVTTAIRENKGGQNWATIAVTLENTSGAGVTIDNSTVTLTSTQQGLPPITVAASYCAGGAPSGGFVANKNIVTCSYEAAVTNISAYTSVRSTVMVNGRTCQRDTTF